MRSEGECEAVSPPSKKSRTADFSALVKRSHSISESILDSSNMVTEKVINDSIHDHIVIPAVAVAIIDTFQFQRLRNIKQVGNCHFVYPNAMHNRFQHSIGVGHLAYKFASKLRAENPTLIDEKDCICVMIAGLCHDLGHGPLSHLWEKFVSTANPDLHWEHEHSSIKMLDYLIEANNLKPVLKELGDLDDQDILFIKECIAGPIDPKDGLPLKTFEPNAKEWLYRGRSEDKSFLYEIVANKISGIDVDKFDYLKRDDYFMKIGTVFRFDRFIHYAKIVKTGTPERRRICIRDKESELVMEMFSDRARMHKKGYQHRVTKVIDQMLVDAWVLADKHIKVRGQNGQLFSLSEACQDVSAHEKLTDDVIGRILFSDSDHPDMIKAKGLIRKIQSRDLYKSIGSIKLKKHHKMRGKDIEKELQEFFAKANLSVVGSEVIVLQSRVTMGMGDRNPIHNVMFYNKHEQIVDDVNSLNISQYLPEHLDFEDYHVVCKSEDKKVHEDACNVVKDFISQCIDVKVNGNQSNGH